LDLNAGIRQSHCAQNHNPESGMGHSGASIPKKTSPQFQPKYSRTAAKQPQHNKSAAATTAIVILRRRFDPLDGVVLGKSVIERLLKTSVRRSEDVA